MTKKKAVEMEIGSILIILLCLAMIIVGLILANKIFFNKPEFKFTKEECRNETYYIPEQCYYDENTLAKDLVACQEKPPKYIEIKKEVCEKVEVDEIQILAKDMKSDYEDFYSECINNNLCEGIYIDNINYGADLFVINKNSNLLTIEFLDENCECWEGINQAEEEIYEECDFPKILAKGTKAETIIEETYKYKCGEYIVEIK